MHRISSLERPAVEAPGIQPMGGGGSGVQHAASGMCCHLQSGGSSIGFVAHAHTMGWVLYGVQTGLALFNHYFRQFLFWSDDLGIVSGKSPD